MYDDRRDQPWQRTVLYGLAALAAGAVILGVVVGVMAAGVVNVTGIGDTDTAEPGEGRASLYLPEYSKTPQVDESEGEESSGPRPRVTAIPLDPTDGPSNTIGEITLYANPTTVASGERINLSGVYLDGDGVSLQVQRQEGGAWLDFPTTAQVSAGGFDTYVYTGRSGDNVFRVFDPTTGRSSNSVTVTVG